MTIAPWWDATFSDLDHDSFGSPAAEYSEIMGLLSPGARILDIGCGDGRHALLFAEAGFPVVAFDSEPAAIRKLRYRAKLRGVHVESFIARMQDWTPDEEYDLVIAHGVLQLVDRSQWSSVLEQMKAATRMAGWNAVTVVTDVLPPDREMSAHFVGLFPDGELFARYADWQVRTQRSYRVDCEHGTDGTHQHAMNKILAQRPRTPTLRRPPIHESQ